MYKKIFFLFIAFVLCSCLRARFFTDSLLTLNIQHVENMRDSLYNIKILPAAKYDVYLQKKNKLIAAH